MAWRGVQTFEASGSDSREKAEMAEACAIGCQTRLRSVLEQARHGADDALSGPVLEEPAESGRGLPQSTTLRDCGCQSFVQCSMEVALPVGRGLERMRNRNAPNELGFRLPRASLTGARGGNAKHAKHVMEALPQSIF
jgi:hypothetical protein